MNTISVWHWLFAIFIIVALGVSDIEYLATGYSRWWTIVYFISLLNIAFVWVLACGLQLIGRLRCAGDRAPVQRNAFRQRLCLVLAENRCRAHVKNITG